MNTMQSININQYILLSVVLFSIGIMGVLFRRNALIIMMSVELMLNAANLLLVSFSKYWNDAAGQVFVFFVMVIAAAEVSVGLAIVVMVYRNTKSTDIEELKQLRN